MLKMVVLMSIVNLLCVSIDLLVIYAKRPVGMLLRGTLGGTGILFGVCAESPASSTRFVRRGL